MKCLRKYFSNQTIIIQYEAAGLLVAQLAYDLCLGKPDGFEAAVQMWRHRELEYAKRGFRPLSIDEFIDTIHSGSDITLRLKERRSRGKPLLFHASRFRQRYVGAHGNFLEQVMVLNEPLQGTFELPTTED